MEERVNQETRYTFEKITKIFNSEIPRSSFNHLVTKGTFPAPHVDTTRVKKNYWTTDQLPEFGNLIGFLKNERGEKFFKESEDAKIITTYTRKGGVLKSTLSYNIARTAALNGYRTLLIGLDNQCDISNMLGYYDDFLSAPTAEMAQELLKNKFGIYDYFTGSKKLPEIIQPTDIPTLYFIPETDYLEDFADEIERARFREEWIKSNIITHLSKKFDLIVFDTSPNSGRLVDNALIVSDLVLSPLECSTNNFRNYARTRLKLTERLNELQKDNVIIKHVPTKTNKTSISKQIQQIYHRLPTCSTQSIKASTAMDAAVLGKVSILEYDATDENSSAIRDLVTEIFQDIEHRDELKNHPHYLNTIKREQVNSHV